MEIKIARPSKKCLRTGRPFEHDEEVVSLIRIEDRTYVREDYAKEAWDPAGAEGAEAVWTSRYYDPAVAEKEPDEKFSPMRRIFYDAVEANTREETAVAYLAAQLLRRQKAFRLIKESDGESEAERVALFADRIGNRFIEVHDPNLTFEEMEKGRQALVSRLRELENEGEDPEGSQDEEREQVQNQAG